MSPTMRVAPVGDRWATWDLFVRDCRASTFAHRGGWAGIVHDVFGHDCDYLVAENQRGEWEGVLPLVHLRGVLGHHLVSMPFLNDGGPIGSEAALRVLSDAAVQ